MNEKWSLDALYTGFDTQEFASDFETLKELCASFKEYAENIGSDDAAETVRKYLQFGEQIQTLGSKIMIYAIPRPDWVRASPSAVLAA